MRIAICAVLFSNDQLIGSQRPRALARILAERGHEVTVFTPEVPADTYAPSPPGVTVVTLPLYSPRAQENIGALPLWQRLIIFASVAPTVPRAFILSHDKFAKIFGVSPAESAAAFEELNKRRKLTAGRTRSLLDAHNWTARAKRATAPRFGSGLTPTSECSLPTDAPTFHTTSQYPLDKNPSQNTTSDSHPRFDAIFATYGPFGSLWFGNVLADHNPHAVRIADMRDAMVIPSLIWTVKGFLAWEEHRTLKDASIVTVISKGVRTAILEQKWNRQYADKIHVLPNGFLRREKSPRPNSSDEAAQKEASNSFLHRQKSLHSAAEDSPGPLRIVYTGQMYRGERDPSPLFRALRVIKDEDPRAEVEVHYAGNQGYVMEAAAAEYGLAEIVTDHGVLPHEAALALQEQADLLLVLSWNRRANQGIISGKFGEYLACEKPILALISGDLAGAELSSLISAMNVGHSHEAVSGEAGDATLTEFLRDAVTRRNSGRPLRYEPVETEVNTFDYTTITEKLERLILEALGSGTVEKKAEKP